MRGSSRCCPGDIRSDSPSRKTGSRGASWRLRCIQSVPWPPGPGGWRGDASAMGRRSAIPAARRTPRLAWLVAGAWRPGSWRCALACMPSLRWAHAWRPGGCSPCSRPASRAPRSMLTGGGSAAPPCLWGARAHCPGGLCPRAPLAASGYDANPPRGGLGGGGPPGRRAGPAASCVWGQPRWADCAPAGPPASRREPGWQDQGQHRDSWGERGVFGPWTRRSAGHGRGQYGRRSPPARLVPGEAGGAQHADATPLCGAAGGRDGGPATQGMPRMARKIWADPAGAAAPRGGPQGRPPWASRGR